MRSKGRLTRRKLLGWFSGVAGVSLLDNPLSMIFSSMMEGFVTRAMAENSGINPRRYIYIQQPGAPPRWTYDLFLNPYADSGEMDKSNPMIGTKYISSQGRYTDMQYSTISYKGVNAPHMWQFDLPKSGGGNRPMTDLLDHLLCIQGITTGNAGHPGSQQLHFKPGGAVRSIPALTGDYAPTPIAGVSLSTSRYIYDSLAGRSPVLVSGGGNLLNTLLAPFQRKASSDFLEKLSRVDSAVNIGLDALDALAKERHPAATSISEGRKGAEELMRKGFLDLEEQWNSLLTKYNSLVKRAISPGQALVGIDDLPIGSSGTRTREYAFNSASNIVEMEDLRLLIEANSDISQMASHFAVAEYVITNNLSWSVSLRTGPMIRLNNVRRNFGFDEHNSGRMVSMYINTMYYRALSACLLELIDQLKSASLFNETVIDVGGEFNRSPRNTMDGSDHGWQGASVAIYSGSIQGPLIVGNLKKNPGGRYSGTWGYGAPVESLGRQLNLADLAATMGTLLRTPSPVTSTGPIVAFDGNTLKSVIGKTKIIP